MKATTLKTITAAQFKKLSNTKKRVLIAKDVIAQIKRKKLVPTRGSVLVIDKVDINSIKYEPVQPLLTKAKKCEVCAKGSVICSLIGKFNHAVSHHVFDMYHGAYSTHQELDTKNIFGVDLWQELECQFEGNSDYRTSNVHRLLDSDNLKVVGKKSLLSLMKNLIENNGKLKVKGKLIG